MPIPAERLTTLLGEIETHLPEALEHDLDISRQVRSHRGVTVILRATVEPPCVEIRHELDWEPTRLRPRVLKIWSASLVLRHPEQPSEGQDLVVNDKQVYTLAPAEAMQSGQRSPVTVEGELHAADRMQQTFIEEMTHLAIAAAQAEREAA